jgi:uncharacterized protein YjbI with pentapeptide repeats
MAWITLVETPLIILLQGQVMFLPYHREWIVWLQRVIVLIDLTVIWHFWIQVSSDNDPVLARARSKVWMCLGGGISLCVVIFSTYLATFPGEWLGEHLPELRFVPTRWWPHWSKKGDWTSLENLLFRGNNDEASERPRSDDASERPRSMFLNRLVLIDQNFVDPNKLGQFDVSHSFRGRDLREAILIRADLRKADFSGAILNGARLDGAKLQNALFGCVIPAHFLRAAKRCVQLQDASFDYADLEGATLRAAELQGASFNFAHLRGASLDDSELQGALFWGADLQGASLERAQLQGAFLGGAAARRIA